MIFVVAGSFAEYQHLSFRFGWNVGSHKFVKDRKDLLRVDQGSSVIITDLAFYDDGYTDIMKIVRTREMEVLEL